VEERRKLLVLESTFVPLAPVILCRLAQQNRGLEPVLLYSEKEGAVDVWQRCSSTLLYSSDLAAVTRVYKTKCAAGIYFLRVARESRSTVSASGPAILTLCTLTHCSSSMPLALGPV